MLYLLRKIFGLFALLYALIFLTMIAGLLVHSELGALAGALLLFTSWIGVPSFVVWAVLKFLARKETPPLLAPPAPAAQAGKAPSAANRIFNLNG